MVETILILLFGAIIGIGAMIAFLVFLAEWQDDRED